MRDDAVAVSLRDARLRDRRHNARRLMNRARDQARAQTRYARALRERAHQQAERAVNRWPVTHGLTLPGQEPPDRDVHELVLDAARGLFGGCGMVSLTTVDQLGPDEPRRSSTAAARGTAEIIDAAQYELAEGPSIDAVELDMVAVLYADDVTGARESGHWPGFAPAAAALGVRSLLSIAVPWTAFRVGLQAQRRALAAINLYASEPHGFAQTEHQAMMFGAWAAATVSGNEPAEIYRAGP